MDSQKVALFTTAGRTDLQVLVRDQSGTLYRSNIEPKNLRAFHESLLSGCIQYIVEGEHEHLPETDARNIEICQDDSGKWQPREPYEFAQKDDNIILVPAKLQQVVLQLRQKYSVRAIVVFNTYRSPQMRNSKDEPIACGKILSEWLAEQFGLEYKEANSLVGEGIATWVDILDGEMEVSGSDRDYPLNREIVCRIDDCMRQFDWNQDIMACLSLGGGIPGTKDVLKACADFRFGPQRVFYWKKPERGKFSMFSPGEGIPTAVDSFEARRHVLKLIQEGDFSGAYASARHLENDPEEIKWVQHLRHTALYFSGMAENFALDSLRALIAPQNPICLLAAMRTEAALWMRRIPEAINWSLTFLDGALLDFMKRLGQIDMAKSTIECTAPDKRLLEQECLEESRQGKQDLYKYNTARKYKLVWIDVIGSKALKEYFIAVDTGSLNAIQLRNQNVHSVLTSEQMEKAKSVFIKNGLWAKKPQNLGNYFIGNSQVRPVLQELGISQPAKLYADVVEEIQQKLSEHECR